MKDASASVKAEENEEERIKKTNRKKKKQPEACILGTSCRAPPPWIGPRLLIGVKEGKMNKEGVILRREKCFRGSATISHNY